MKGNDMVCAIDIDDLPPGEELEVRVVRRTTPQPDGPGSAKLVPRPVIDTTGETVSDRPIDLAARRRRAG